MEEIVIGRQKNRGGESDLNLNLFSTSAGEFVRLGTFAVLPSALTREVSESLGKT
jgi:hypothetical protein